jgi:HlyD family secretion protein
MGPGTSSTELEIPAERPRRRLENVLAARPRRSRGLLFGALAFVALAGIGAAYLFISVERPVTVDVVAVASGPVERTVVSVAAGRVAARHRARVAAPFVGRVVALPVAKGARVEKDQVIVELDATKARAKLDEARGALEGATAALAEGEAALDEARSALAGAGSAVEAAKAAHAMACDTQGAAVAAAVATAARLESARGDLARYRELEKSAIVAAEVVEHAAREVESREAELKANQARAASEESRVRSLVAELEGARSRVAAATARVSSAEAQLKIRRARVAETRGRESEAQAIVDDHTIRAPFAGVLSDLWVELGEVTAQRPAVIAKATSESGGSRLFEVLDPSDLYVTAPIDEADVARVAVGAKVRVTIESSHGEPLLGTVTRIAPYVLDVEDQNRTVEVEVSLPKIGGREALPGASAEIEVLVEQKSSVPRLPTNVLINGRRVLVLETDPSGVTRAVERAVEVPIESWRFAEVSLALGTKVVAPATSGRVRSGQRVVVRHELAP